MIRAASTDEVLETFRQAKDNDVRVRVFGNTFPLQGECGDILLDLSPMHSLVACDPEKEMVKVEAGMTLMELAEVLQSFNLALPFAGPMPNLTIIDAISLGIIASNTSIADSLEKCEVILASGETKEVRWPSEEEERKAITEGEMEPTLNLQSVVSGLGLTGAITSATFKCNPLHTLLESNRQVTLPHFLENWEKMSQAYYIHARWFTQIDTILVTSAFSMRLHLSYKQPILDQIFEQLWMLGSRAVSYLRAWVAWLFPKSAALMSHAHCYFLRNAVYHRTNFCYPVQKFVPLRKHCRGVKWILPANRKESVLKKLSTWAVAHPHLCSSPAEISIQKHNRRPNAFLSPHTADNTFSIKVDWFTNTCTFFSPELAEFESLLQMHGGRKCWSVGPVSVSPLIGHLYDGFARWRNVKSSVDRICLLRSAYVDGDLIIHRF